MTKIHTSRLTNHLRQLTEQIGVRLAGTDQELAAAEYVADQFRKSRASVSVESFPVQSRDVTEERLEIKIGNSWKTFPCSLFSNTPGTNGQQLEAPIVFFEAPAESTREDLSHLRGKAVVHLGTHIESRTNYQRLIEASPAWLMLVDIRYPGDVPLADGMFPAYTCSLGAVPTVNVAFQHAWDWKVDRATDARLSVQGGMRATESQNVIADFPGQDPTAGMILLGAHHDTQADSVGADDNATGVAGLIELARELACDSRQRTVRLISFGTEEQLSVGSAEYVRHHRGEVEREARLIFNLDSYGSYLGWTELFCNGPSQLQDYLRSYFKSYGLYVRFSDECMPYADHFPFAAAGVPAITMIRQNCIGGRFFHHRPDDDLSRVDASLMARLLDVVLAIVDDLACREILPFDPSIPPSQSPGISKFWQDLFNGWKGF